MPLAVGARLGPYEITGMLGAGGMGKVYRARDTRLKRDVALKILPESFATDPDRLARFQREAEVLASLNHPNIAAIYGLEEADGVKALVMELVEGPTVADRISEGAIPTDEALPIARQIAEALEAAHEQGIIHRDLKPANIKLRPDGTVKVLDFGLAKAMEPVGAGVVHLSQSPTITSPAMTLAGIVLGTAAYMSPEQARGKTVNRRTDIWAFGCVLYEMLTGRRAFDEEDVSMTLSKVLQREPDFEAFPSRIPPRVRQAIRLCLQKDVRERAGDIHDVRLALEGAFDSAPGNAGAQAAAVCAARHETAVSMRLRAAIVGAATLVIGGALMGATVWFATPPDPPSVIRTEIATAGATALSVQGNDLDLAITPDGSRVVYRGANQLLVRALGRLEPDVLTGLGEPRGLFVSPDGHWVGFFEADSLKKVGINGGPPVTITSTVGGAPRGATWGPDGTIVYATASIATGLRGVSAAGGDSTVLTTPDRGKGEGGHLWPEYLPGGRVVLFTIAPIAANGLENAQIAVFDLDTGTSKVVLRGGHHARYVQTGHLVYGAGGTLRAVAFDLDRLEVVGTPVPVVEQVVTTTPGAVNAAVAASGTLVYLPGRGVVGGARSLVWVDRTGREEPVPAPVRAYQYPRISPDGTRIALDIRDQEQDIWIWDVTREILTRFTFDPAADQYPVWSPDSRRILFNSARSGAFSLFWQAADGTGTVERLTEGPNAQFAQTMTPDGSRVIFKETIHQDDLLLLPLQPPRRSQLLIQTMSAERNPEIAPDGRWVAYESNESGREEIYVRPFPDVSGGRWQISSGGGRMPLWSRSGEELFYISPDGALMVARVEAASSWRNSAATRLLEGQYLYRSGAFIGRTYDIAPDGRRFLMIKDSLNEGTPRNIVVVQNWAEELKRLVPVN